MREGIRRYYRDHLPLTGAARAARRLNPGNGWVSRLCHDPRVAVAVLGQMLAPYELSGKLLMMRSHREVAALTDGDRVAGVVVRRRDSGQES